MDSAESQTLHGCISVKTCLCMPDASRHIGRQKFQRIVVTASAKGVASGRGYEYGADHQPSGTRVARLSLAGANTAAGAGADGRQRIGEPGAHRFYYAHPEDGGRATGAGLRGLYGPGDLLENFGTFRIDTGRDD